MDLLESGPDREPRRSLSGWSPRTRVALLLVVALLAGGGFLLDRSERRSEAQALEACASRADGAWETASSRLSSTFDYLRATLSTDAGGPLRRSLLGILTDAAERGRPAMVAAADGCADVHVRFWHDDLQARRGRCLQVARARLNYLEAVVSDGAMVLEPPPPADPECRRA